MPWNCTVCRSPQRDAINLALMLHSDSYRKMAQRFGVGLWALYRHEQNHLQHSLELSKELTAMLQADNLLENLGKWHERMEAQYTKADKRDEIANAAAVARVGLAAIEQFARFGPNAVIDDKIAELQNPALADDSDDKDGTP